MGVVSEFHVDTKNPLLVKVDQSRRELGLKTMFTSVKGAVWKVMFALRKSAQARSPVDTGYFKRNWSMPKKIRDSNKQFGYFFENQTPYSDDLEYGLYTKVGAKTVAIEGGIFSRQAPGGILSQIMNDEDYMKSAFDAALAGSSIPVRPAEKIAEGGGTFKQSNSMYQKIRGKYSESARLYRKGMWKAYSYRSRVA